MPFTVRRMDLRQLGLPELEDWIMVRNWTFEKFILTIRFRGLLAAYVGSRPS